MSHNITRDQILNILGLEPSNNVVATSANHTQAPGTNTLTFSGNGAVPPTINSTNFTRYENLRNRLGQTATLVDGELAAGSGTGRRATLLSEMRRNSENNENIKQIFDGLEGAKNPELQRTIKRTGREMERDAKQFYELAEKTKAGHQNALAELATVESKLVSDLTTRFTEATRLVNQTAGLSNADKNVRITQLETNYQNARQSIQDYVQSHRSHHNDIITEIKTVAEDVEKSTGIKPPASITKTESALAKAGEDAAKTAEHEGAHAPKGAGALKIGAGAVVGGLAANMLMPGEKDEGWMNVKTVIGAVIGGVAAAMLFKGKGAAAGHSH